MKDITAVLGIYMGTPEQYQRTLTFLADFIQRFPDIPLKVSCVGSLQEYQDELKKLYGDRVVTGTAERVSFSETWNSAILGVETSKFVFLHNDMYILSDFFDQLNSQYLLDNETKSFYVYTTIEPLQNRGFLRPGKIVADFGEDLSNFKKEKFLTFARKYQETHKRSGRGYGFYVAGFTEALKDVGGFDFLTFTPIFCEDDDLMVRIRIKGYALKTAPAAIVYHFGSKTTREMGAQGMTPSEIEQNRKFARKWGFEARYLWETGYEFEDTPLEVGTETIGYQVELGQSCSALNLLNIEPFVDRISSSSQKLKEYLDEEGFSEKSGPVDSCDIIITQIGPSNFNELAYLIGDLRFNCKDLEVGVRDVGNYRVDVRRVRKDFRIDSKNYLSLLQNRFK